MAEPGLPASVSPSVPASVSSTSSGAGLGPPLVVSPFPPPKPALSPVPSPADIRGEIAKAEELSDTIKRLSSVTKSGHIKTALLLLPLGAFAAVGLLLASTAFFIPGLLGAIILTIALFVSISKSSKEQAGLEDKMKQLLLQFPVTDTSVKPEFVLARERTRILGLIQNVADNQSVRLKQLSADFNKTVRGEDVHSTQKVRESNIEKILEKVEKLGIVRVYSEDLETDEPRAAEPQSFRDKESKLDEIRNKVRRMIGTAEEKSQELKSKLNNNPSLGSVQKDTEELGLLMYNIQKLIKALSPSVDSGVGLGEGASVVRLQSAVLVAPPSLSKLPSPQ